MKVRITGWQKVYYSQVVEMTEGNFARLMALDVDQAADEVRDRIDPTNVYKADEIEDIELEPAK